LARLPLNLRRAANVKIGKKWIFVLKRPFMN
jgi:hypothetical protein